MSSKTTSQSGWMFASSKADTLWGPSAISFPYPVGTPGADILKGTNNVDGFYGQGGNGTIYGYGGSDALAGGAGNDKLYGGKGSDTFFFDAKLNAKTNVDRIMDFSSKDDTIGLSRYIFKKAGTGPLKEAAFYAGKKAHDKDDRIIYDKKTGSLYYDPDGTGPAAMTKFAIINNKVTLTFKDFAIG